MPLTVDKILSNFAHELSGSLKAGSLKPEHFDTTNRNKLNETHSLVLGLLWRSVYLVIQRDYMIALGHGLKVEGKRKFTPDMSIWQIDLKRLMGIIDFESTNSSDSRIVERDLRNYKDYTLSAESQWLPEFWITITTLPSRQVEKRNWFSWDIHDKKIIKEEYGKVLENPFRYYYPKYRAQFLLLEKEREKCPLYLVNLDPNELRCCLPDEGKSYALLTD